MTPTTLRDLNNDLAQANGRLVLRVKLLEEVLRELSTFVEVSMDLRTGSFSVEGRDALRRARAALGCTP